MSDPATAAKPPPRQALARAVGLAAFVYGYPLLESMRTCAVQTGAVPAPGRAAACAPIDQLLHWAGPTQAEDRDVVTPANDLMYSTAWIHLAAGPRWLTVPAAAEHPGRYFVLALYDAYTENFENLGPRNCAPGGERVLLVGPNDTTAPPAGVRVLRAQTNLVWLLARVLVVDADDLPAARRLQAQIGIEALAGTGAAPLPLALQHWQGPARDPMAAVLEQGVEPEGPAGHFYGNLCHALADAPGRMEDQGLLAWLAVVGLQAGAGFDWAALDEATRAGLVQGFAEGVALVAEAMRHRQARPWVLSWHNGRYGSRYLVRAIVAYIGLGALHTGEALYASGHFDADGQLFDGRQPYTLHFEPEAMPPAEAFWSVTLYDADRYLYPNPLRRHAVGDRTRGLRRDPDGGLTLRVQHEAPLDPANWLPAPAGRFYLILRLYHPREDARGWRIPPLQRSSA
jgi:hypothetical protein